MQSLGVLLIRVLAVWLVLKALPNFAYVLSPVLMSDVDALHLASVLLFPATALLCAVFLLVAARPLASRLAAPSDVGAVPLDEDAFRRLALLVAGLLFVSQSLPEVARSLPEAFRDASVLAGNHGFQLGWSVESALTSTGAGIAGLVFGSILIVLSRRR